MIYLGGAVAGVLSGLAAFAVSGSEILAGLAAVVVGLATLGHLAERARRRRKNVRAQQIHDGLR